MTNQSRRNFLKNSLSLSAGAAALSFMPQAVQAWPRPTENKISLATWSIHHTFNFGGWKMDDLFRIVREDFGLDGIEHVNQFFDIPTARNLRRWNKLAEKFEVENVLIMVDHEGQLVAKDKQERKQAVIDHRKWVDAAAYMNCHAIRCNAHGGGNTPEEDPDAIERAADSFHQLVEYAKEQKVNIIVENHGGLSSHPGWLQKLCEKVDSPHFGLLPDYGNYPQGVNVYEQIEQAMQYAKGVSVKTSWTKDGVQKRHDLPRLLEITKESGYTGYWGIESGYQFVGRPTTLEEAKEGEWKAVRWTKEAIQKHVFNQG